MAITSVASAVNNLRPPIHFVRNSTVGSQFVFAGNNTISTTASGVAITSISQFTKTDFKGYSNPESGQYSYITRVDLTSDMTSSSYSNRRGVGIILCDVLWASSGISPGLGIQTINSVDLPARDVNESINGEGIVPIIYYTSNIGAGGGNIFINYTNSAGTPGRVGRVDLSNDTLALNLNFIGLQSGDIGVKSIQTLEFDVDHLSGTFIIALVRPLTVVTSNVTKTCNGIDSIYTTKLFNDTTFLPVFVRVAGFYFAGSVYITQG